MPDRAVLLLIAVAGFTLATHSTVPVSRTTTAAACDRSATANASLFANRKFKLPSQQLPIKTVVQQQLILRDLTVVEGTTIQFDRNSVRVDTENAYGWDEVHSAKLDDAAIQSEFDQLLRSHGIPLFRLKQRLSVGAWDALPEIGESLTTDQAQLPTAANARNEYLIRLANYRGQLARGERELALLAFVRLNELLRNVDDSDPPLPDLPNAGLDAGEISSGLARNLLPIFFDRKQAADALKSLDSLFATEQVVQPDGNYIYRAALAIASEHPKAAEILVMLGQRQSDAAKSWKQILDAWAEVVAGTAGSAVSELRVEQSSLSGAKRAAANYILGGYSLVPGDDLDASLLDLLYIPANFGDRYPSISAAALFRAAEIATRNNRPGEVRKLEAELVANYANTFHGRKMMQQPNRTGNQ